MFADFCSSRDRIQVNNARVTSVDVKASNGVIHVIDRVLLPPNLK
ncbi:fasciclin domain-containing protein [Leptolyngbya sp. AN03gr2]